MRHGRTRQSGWALARAAGGSLALVVVLTATTALAAPPPLYVDGDAPRDGTGTAASPFNSLASLQAALTAAPLPDRTVNLAGTFRGQKFLIIGGLSGATIGQWPGGAPAVIRGDVPITGSWTATPGTTRYSIPLGAGLDVVSVVEDWDTRIDVRGRHFGHLQRVATPAAVEATPSSWHYDGSLMHIHPTSDLNPNTSGRSYAWCSGGNAFLLLNMSRCVIDGLSFALWVDADAGEGYGIFMGGAVGSTIRRCTATDYGFHGFGFVGNLCVNNVFDRCTTAGGRDNGSTGYVFFASSGQVSGRASDCQAHLYRLLDAHGAPLVSTGFSADGFYTHAFGGALTDIEFQRCTAWGYENRSGFAFGAGEFAAAPADPNDPATYPVRYVDCRLVNGATNNINSGARVAFVRCAFDLTRMAELMPTSATAINTQSGFGGARLLFESCTIAANSDNVPGASVLRLADGVAASLRGCVLYDHGLATSGTRAFVRYAGPTAALAASQSVFAHRVPQRLAIANAGVSVSVAAQAYDRCWYSNIQSVDGYSPNPSVDSLLEFQRAIDPSGTYGVDPQFIAPPLNLEGAAGGALLSTRLIVPGVDRLGINLLPYSGHYGAYQYGPATPCPADLDRNGVVNGLDLAIVLGAWSGAARYVPCPPPAPTDFNGDCRVNGLDLAVLLGAWGPC